MSSVNCKFVSRKINKIRWRPSHSSLRNADTFVSGGWNDQDNKVSVWHIPEPREPADITTDQIEDDTEPQLLCEVGHDGDVTALQFVNQDNFVAASSNGSISLYTEGKLQQWRVAHRWESVHCYETNPCSCTGVVVRGDEMVSVGEDGRITYTNTANKKHTRVIDCADSCSMTAVDFIKQQEIITANMRGQLKVWDTRGNKDGPTATFHFPGDIVSILCVTHHPTQPQVVATGQEDGMICIWDMRTDKNPVSVLQAHSGPVSELMFHPTSPDHLFTCSMDGSVWHWDGSGLNEPTQVTIGARNRGKEPEVKAGNPWLSCEAAKNRLDIFSLIPSSHLPVNTLDVDGNTLICGSDNEAIYVIDNLSI